MTKSSLASGSLAVGDGRAPMPAGDVTLVPKNKQ
jgi:hypothetical protein